MPKVLARSLSTLLVTAVISQLAFGTLVMAQTPNNQDPFWSDKGTTGGQIDPNNSNLWFNNNNPLAGGTTDDPWGNWDSSNDGPLDNSNWGDQNSDPWGVFGSWSPNNASTSKMTDSTYVKLLRMSGVLSKDYISEVAQFRTQYSAYGTEDDDAIADIIIKNRAERVGKLGAGIAVVPTGIHLLMPSLLNSSGALSYGVLGTGLLMDFIAIIYQETSLMFELQELYGGLSSDDDDRTADALLPFILGMGGAALNKMVAQKLQIATSDVPTAPLQPVIPGPGPQPGPPTPDPFAPPAPAPAPGPVPAPPTPSTNLGPAIGGTSTTSRILGNPIVATAAQTLNWALIRGQLIHFILRVSPLTAKIAHNGKTVAENFVNAMPPEMQIVGASVLAGLAPYVKAATKLGFASAFSYYSNKESCLLFGQWAKRYYKAMHQVELANVISQVRADNRAKAVLWIILLKDVFQDPKLPVSANPNGQILLSTLKVPSNLTSLPPVPSAPAPAPTFSALQPAQPQLSLSDAKLYATIMNREFPLVYTSKWDELASIQNDYQNHPDLLDTYLGQLRNDLPADAKLYMVELVAGGMLMKGGMNYNDNTILTNLAVALGLYPPSSKVLGSLKPNSPQMMDWARYKELINRLKMATQMEGAAKSSSLLPKSKTYVLARRNRSGQIIVQDFEDSNVKPSADILTRVRANGGWDGSTLGQKNTCANAIAIHSGDPMTNINPGADASQGCKVSPNPASPSSAAPVDPYNPNPSAAVSR